MSVQFPIYLFEEHSSSLPVWWQARDTPSTVVYLDAHLDLQQISEDRIEALKQCQTLAQIKALEAPHHLNPSPDYSFGIENFLFAASELDLITRLIWVVPPHIPRAYSASLLDIVQQMEGVSFAELSSFKTVGKDALRGTLLGLDITLCGFEDLHHLQINEPWYLDVDIDYFVRVPDDTLWADPSAVISGILAQLGNPEIATISRAVDSGFTPLSMRFIADYVEAILIQDQGLSRHYAQLTLALNHLTQGRTPLALETGRQVVESMPDCAAGHYLMSLIIAQANHADDQIRATRKKAIDLDGHYAVDLARIACGFPNRHQVCSTTLLDALGKQLSSADTSNSASSEIAVGLLYAAQGQLKLAWQLLQKQTGVFSGHCELRMAIARGILQSSEPGKAKELLELTAQSNRTRCSAQLSLGDLALHAGDTQTALSHYQKVSSYAPAWLLPLEQQALCLERLNEAEPLKQLRHIIEQRKRQLAHLISG